MPSKLFSDVANRQLSRQLKQRQDDRYPPKPVVQVGTILADTRILVEGQQYTLAKAGTDLPVGGQLAVQGIQRPADQIYAPADASSMVVLSGGGGGGNGGGNGPPFNDKDYVRRDGTRSLLAGARWLWDLGAQVNGVFRSWGNGLIQVYGKLYAGRLESSHVLMGDGQNEDGAVTHVLESASGSNAPIFSIGATEGVSEEDENGLRPETVRAAWVSIGYQETPHIRTGYKDGYARPLVLVDPELLSRLLDRRDIDVAILAKQMGWPHGLTLPEPLDYPAGVPFLLQSPGDPNLFVLYIRDHLDNWQLLGGAGYMAPHSHNSNDTGGALPLNRRWEPLTNGNPDAPELVFGADGDVIMCEVSE